MEKYHKIQTVFKRDPATKHKNLLEGQFSLDEFEYLQNNPWVYTEKVDGTNIRVKFDGVSSITFGGKTDNAQIPATLINRLNDIFLPQVDIFKEIFDFPVCLYGEGYGAKIQKGGGNYCPVQEFVLFDILVKDGKNEWWLQRHNVEDIQNKLSIDIVPIIGEGTLGEMVEMTRKGFNSIWGDFQAEGIVARPKTELKTRSGNRIITKIKCKDFKEINGA